MLSKSLELNELKHLYKNAGNKRYNLYYMSLHTSSKRSVSVFTFRKWPIPKLASRLLDS